MFPTLARERSLWNAGHVVAGVDEVGRGAWAGPLVAAAVILPQRDARNTLRGLKESKQLAPTVRERFYSVVIQMSVWAVGVVDVEALDAMGVGEANRVAIRQALAGLSVRPTFALIDAFTVSHALCPTQGVVFGDERVRSIAAASIVAKVFRDRLMVEEHARDPRYRFDLHKGYGTALHQQRLQRYGPSPSHRRSFAPIAELHT